MKKREWSADDIRKVLGKEQSEAIIAQLVAASVTPLSEVQLDNMVMVARGEVGKGAIAALPALREFFRANPAIGGRAIAWAETIRSNRGYSAVDRPTDTAGVRGAILAELRHGPMTAKDLAVKLGFAGASSVYPRLRELEGERKVVSAEVHLGSGHRSTAYRVA